MNILLVQDHGIEDADLEERLADCARTAAERERRCDVLRGNFLRVAR